MAILRYALYRFGTMLLTLLVVSVMVFVIINSVIDDLLEGAGGSGGFADNGLVRAATFIGPTAVVGYGMWIWYRSRWPRD